MVRDAAGVAAAQSLIVLVPVVRAVVVVEPVVVTVAVVLWMLLAAVVSAVAERSQLRERDGAGWVVRTWNRACKIRLLW